MTRLRTFSDSLTETMTDANFEQLGIEIKYSVELKTAKMYAGKSNKPVFYNKFQSVERMRQVIAYYVQQFEKRAADKLAKAAAKKENNVNFEAADHFKVGEILVNTWGWEQTNTDFYQVVSMTPKTIKVRSIAAASVEGSEGFMSDRVTPVKNKFIESGKEYNLRVGRRANGQLYIAQPANYYYFHKWEGKAEYRSWYA